MNVKESGIYLLLGEQKESRLFRVGFEPGTSHPHHERFNHLLSHKLWKNVLTLMGVLMQPIVNGICCM